MNMTVSFPLEKPLALHRLPDKGQVLKHGTQGPPFPAPE